MGFVAYHIDPDGYKFDNVMERNMIDLLNYIRVNLKISDTKHFFSKNNMEDSIKYGINIEESLKRHFKYVVTNAKIDDKLKDKLLSHYNEIGSYYSEEIYSLVYKLLDKIGIEEYNKLTIEYNNILENERLKFLKEKEN